MESSECLSAGEPTPGELLRSAREALGISRREMADRLNWMPGYVVAIEESRFEVLPGAAFVRGYLRAYAKLVAVPEDTLMAAYAAFPGGEMATEESRKRVESKIPQIQKKGIAIPAGAAIVALVVFLLWYGRGEDQQGDVAPVSAVTEHNEIDAPKQAEALVQEQSVTLPVVPESAPATSELETPAEANAAASTTALPAGAAETVGIESEPPQVSRSPEPASTAAPVPGTPAAPAVAAGYPAAGAAGGPLDAGPKGQLHFRFSGDCWVEVRNATGELIYADLRREGDVLNLSGEAPFNVLLGDASVVELDYLGQAVTIKRRPGRQTARFMVGEQ